MRDSQLCFNPSGESGAVYKSPTFGTVGCVPRVRSRTLRDGAGLVCAVLTLVDVVDVVRRAGSAFFSY